MLPGYGISPQNALLDFTPINQGVTQYRKGMEDNQNYLTAQKVAGNVANKDYSGAMSNALMGDRADLAGLAMHAQTNASQMESAAMDRTMKMAQMHGAAADRALKSGNQAAMQAAWGSMVSSHPDYAANLQKFGVDPADYKNGLNFVRDQAASHLQQLELQRAQIANLNRREDPDIVRTLRAAGVDPRSEQGKALILNSVKGGSPMDQMIATAMQNAMKNGNGQQPAPQQQGGIVPQSFDGVQPEGGIIPVQTAPQAAPQQAPATPMVQTPFGPLPKNQADIMGFGLAMQGKGEAGKMMMGEDKLSKSATEQNDKGALNSIEQSSRLDSIAAKFKPEYQTYETGIKMGVDKLRDSFGATRKSMAPEERQKLAEYTQFRQDSMNNLSAYIKEITGAAMGIQEEKRIRAGMPDPEKDSPIEFESKMKNSIATAKLALARHAYLKSQGYNDASVAALAKADKLGTIHSLDDMKSVINSRMEAAASQIKQQNPNINDMQLRQQLKMIQRREFGI